MTVRELIEHLQKLEQDKYVVISGYEGGCDFPNFFPRTQIVLNQNTEWYYGKHEFIMPTDERYIHGEWNAYIIENK